MHAILHNCHISVTPSFLAFLRRKAAQNFPCQARIANGGRRSLTLSDGVPQLLLPAGQRHKPHPVKGAAVGNALL